jgi:hypothetical protein
MKGTLPLILLIGFMFTISLSISLNMANADRETIGQWIVDDYPTLKGSIIEIYEDGGNFYSYWIYNDGITTTDILTRKGKATFYNLGSESGDHYIINRMNQLEIRDDLGLITTARPLK